MSVINFKKIAKYLHKSFYVAYVPNSFQWRIRCFLARGCVKGRGVKIDPSVHMTGAANIKIGNYTAIGEHTWMNVNHALKDNFAITIGENCFIGRRNFFTSGVQIFVGDFALTAPDCRFICASHIFENPDIPAILSGVTNANSIYIGANCSFGAGVTVIGNVSIGHGSIIGAGSLVNKDVPPFSIVVGSPARILRRYSFSKKKWINSEMLTEFDLIKNPEEAEYLNALRASFPKIYMPLPAIGKAYGNI